MATVTTRDGTNIFYKDWGSGQPVVFSHGWPLSADAWDGQMQALGEAGFRVVAHDRRSHGRSDQTWSGNDMDHYADDLAALIEALDLKDVVLVSHSTGGGEVSHYCGRHGLARVAKAVLISAVPPIMVRTEANPGGLPIEVFDDIRRQTLENRAQFFLDITVPFFGYNREGVVPSEGIQQDFWRQGMMGGIKGQYDCIHEFSEVDYTPDLQKMTIPVLVLHGDDDQIVPIDAAGRASAKILPNATLKEYKGAPHGLPQTRQAEINADLIGFIRG